MKFNEVYEKYYQHKASQLKPATLRYYRGYYNNWLREPLGEQSIYDISGESLAEALQECAPVLFNRIKTFTAGVFGYAKVYCGLSDLDNPTTQLTKNKEKPRKRYVREEEWEAIRNALVLLDKGSPDENDFALFIRMMLYMGLRKSEAENSRIENVDFKRECILISGKTGEREVPLPEVILNKLRKVTYDVGFIFPAKKTNTKGRNFSYRWIEFRKAHGLEGLTRHDLRRTFGVTALNNDLSYEETAALLGHTSINTTQKHYAWLSTSSKRRASAEVAEALEKNLAGGKRRG